MTQCTMNTQCGYRDYQIQIYTDDYQLYNLIEMEICKIREMYFDMQENSQRKAVGDSE